MRRGLQRLSPEDDHVGSSQIRLGREGAHWSSFRSDSVGHARDRSASGGDAKVRIELFIEVLRDEIFRVVNKLQ
jgi:hypothetical protein